MLRRLARKGSIKIVNVQKSRLRYLVTPKGLLEKARLTCEYIEYSLLLYRNIRSFLRERFVDLARNGRRRILLWGTGELAEIAWLTIQEAGFELVGVVDDEPRQARFFGQPVRPISEIAAVPGDYVLVASLQAPSDVVERLGRFGIPAAQVLLLPQPRGSHLPLAVGGEASAVPTDVSDTKEPIPEFAVR
jgi:hypothetical protein